MSMTNTVLKKIFLERNIISRDFLEMKLNMVEQVGIINIFKQRVEEIKQKLEKELTWGENGNSNVKLLKEYKKLLTVIEYLNEIEQYSKDIDQFEEMKEIVESKDEVKEIDEIVGEYDRKLRIAISNFMKEILFTDKYDKHSCFIRIKIGLGGYESYLWVKMLTEMYTKFLNQFGINTDVLEIEPNEYGYRYVNIYVNEPYAYGFFKIEHGSHRLIEISPFSKKRQTTIGIIEIIPDIPMEDIKIDPNEIRIDTYRASGPGGQYVNKTESAVRITHIPTGIVVSIQTERSQHKNKEMAMKILYYKLQKYYRKEQEKQLDSIVENIDGNFGAQIRTYTLHPYKVVKDNRVGDKEYNPDSVLNGGFDLLDMMLDVHLNNLIEKKGW